MKLFGLLPLFVWTPGMVSATSTTVSSPAQVNVHVLERYSPFASTTVVGAIQSTDVPPDYRLVLSFKAFEFNTTNGDSMDCFSVLKPSAKWTKLTAAATPMTPSFCVARDGPTDATSFAIAPFQKTDADPVAVLASQSSSSSLVAEAKIRGWIHAPLASFHVSHAKQWQADPVLTFVSAIHVATAPTIEELRTLCQPDANGTMDRKLEPGNYYAGTKTATIVASLCVSYVRRSLQDIQPKEQVVSRVRFHDSESRGRSSKVSRGCPPGYDEAVYTSSSKQAEFVPRPGSRQVLCFSKTSVIGLKNTSDLTDTTKLLKRVALDESVARLSDRLHAEYHSEKAWDVPAAQQIDWNAVNEF